MLEKYHINKKFLAYSLYANIAFIIIFLYFHIYNKSKMLQLLLLALAFSTADDTLNVTDLAEVPVEAPSKKYQQNLMFSLFGFHPRQFSRAKTAKPPRPPYPIKGVLHFICGWEGVTCTNGDVTNITWNTKKTPRVYIKWLPSSLIHVSIANQVVTSPLDTRLLPKHLHGLEIASSNIEGSIDLGSLPESLKVLKLPRNMISGFVSLERLPTNIREIDLSGNRIDRVYGSANCLPECFQSGNFVRAFGKVKYISLDKSPMSFRIQLRKMKDPLLINPLFETEGCEAL